MAFIGDDAKVAASPETPEPISGGASRDAEASGAGQLKSTPQIFLAAPSAQVDRPNAPPNINLEKTRPNHHDTAIHRIPRNSQQPAARALSVRSTPPDDRLGAIIQHLETIPSLSPLLLLPLRAFSTTTACCAKKKKMPPKKAAVQEKIMLGRPGNNLKSGINYPYATIDPEEARVIVPDERYDWLCEHYKPASRVPAHLTVYDIAGLTRGASTGAGLGNAFLSHIRAVDAIFQVVRCFDDAEIIHVEGDVDPIRDLEIIADELRVKDTEFVQKSLEALKKQTGRGGQTLEMKKLREEQSIVEAALKCLTEEKQDVRKKDWGNKEVEVINSLLLLTAKPVIYVVNLSEKDYIRQKNKHLPKIFKWVQENSPGDMIIPLSVAYEERLSRMEDDEAKKEQETLGAKSALGKLVVNMRKELGLGSFFTCGTDEVRQWTIRKGTKAPQAAGVIHTDFEKTFIQAVVSKYEDLVALGSEAELKAKGKIATKGKEYVVEDGDILHAAAANTTTTITAINGSSSVPVDRRHLVEHEPDVVLRRYARVDGFHRGLFALRLTRLAAQVLQVLEVRGVAAGDVLTVENADFKLPHRRRLVDHLVGTDLAGDLRFGAVVRYQLFAVREVDAVDMRVTNRRRAACEVDFIGPRFTGHAHDFTAGGPADNAVVDEQHVAALEFRRHGVQLAADGRGAGRLAWHDEGAEDIAVLHEPLDIGLSWSARAEAEVLEVSGMGMTASIAFMAASPRMPRGLHRDIIDDRVWAGKVDELKDVRGEGGLRVHLPKDRLCSLLDDNSFAGLYIADVAVPENVECDALAGKHVVASAVGILLLAEDERADAVWVAEADDAEPGEHGSACVCALASRVDALEGTEEIFFVYTELAGFLQRAGKDVEHHLAVGIGVDVPMDLLVQVLAQLGSIDEVAVLM
ncbi:LOW QUALITY PROTEIN: hypothetical protein Dda_5946 [Drechslerella dactyloides]|uniref:Obg-like ATPase homolog n=1 Tax=Drechslerella dactyloides TaxID=74499 RepID=A0AAD6IWU3_DREDA|nr:LOW QUALITY PROTEIN: hypothetical protein Dda_5946 [Drechslerella dactyloides]